MKPDCDPAIPAIAPPHMQSQDPSQISPKKIKSKVQPGKPPPSARDQPPESSVEQAGAGGARAEVKARKRVSRLTVSRKRQTGEISGDVVRLRAPMVCRKNEEKVRSAGLDKSGVGLLRWRPSKSANPSDRVEDASLEQRKNWCDASIEELAR